MIEVEDCLRAEEQSLPYYAKRSEEWLTKIVAKDVEEMKDGKTYRKRKAREREDQLLEQKLHADTG